MTDIPRSPARRLRPKATRSEHALGRPARSEMTQALEHRFDPEIADTMLRTSNAMPGLPAYLGLELIRFAPGRLWARATLTPQLETASGNVHGGALASILDHVAGAVVYPLMPQGHWGATTELKLNYVAPAQAGQIDAEAEVLAMSNRSAVVRGELRYNERLVCAAQGTVAIVPPRAT